MTPSTGRLTLYLATLMLAGCSYWPRPPVTESDVPPRTITVRLEPAPTPPPCDPKTLAAPSAQPVLQTVIQTYLDGLTLDATTRRQRLEALPPIEAAGTDETTRLTRLALLASSNSATDRRRAEALIAEQRTNGDSAATTVSSQSMGLPWRWLQQTLEQHQRADLEARGLRQALTESQAAQGILEAELNDLREKIDALTQIEQTLIEKTGETVTP